MATATAQRMTSRNDGTTSTWDAPRFVGATRAIQSVAGQDDSGLHLFYAFPSPQRTARPGLPQQTRQPSAP